MKAFRFANRKCSSQYIRGAKSIMSLAILIMLSVSVPSILNAGQKAGLSAGPKAESQVPSKKTKPKMHQAEKVELKKTIDLLATGWFIDVAEAKPGESLAGKVKAEWRNIGTGSTGKGYYVQIKLSDDSEITKGDPSLFDATVYMDELPKGHSEKTIFHGRKVKIHNNTVCGRYYYIGPFVDSSDDIKETSESNNYNSMRFFIRCN